MPATHAGLRGFNAPSDRTARGVGDGSSGRPVEAARHASDRRRNRGFADFADDTTHMYQYLLSKGGPLFDEGTRSGCEYTWVGDYTSDSSKQS